MDPCLPEERCPAASNTLPLESSDPLPHTEIVSPCMMEENATMPSLIVNNHLLETLFTPPNTSGEPASTDNPPELMPPQILICTMYFATPPSRQESSMHLV